KGLGAQKAALVNKELGIFTYGDLLQHYPFRYEDRTKFYKINQLGPDLDSIQLVVKVRQTETIGEGRRKRLVAHVMDETGQMELTWFKGIQWAAKKLVVGATYVVFGKPNLYGRKYSIAHPDLEPLTAATEEKSFYQPIYPTTEKLRLKFLDSKGISKVMEGLLSLAYPLIQETLPADLLGQFGLMPKKDAIRQIHFPQDPEKLNKARFRLKFEEFFFVQLRLLKLKLTRTEKFQGQVLNQTKLLTQFYKEHLPFDLTNAQKRVIKEAFGDLKSGQQMNRLLQGDVGSGKTMVAFICILIAIGSGAQACLMAPTELLANQHHEGLKEY